MKNQTIFLAVACSVSTLFYCCSNSSDTAVMNDSALSSNNDNSKYGGYSNQTDWGEHLTVIGGCNDCHTPKKMTDKGPVDDTSLLLSGHAAQAPVAVLMHDQLAKGMAATFDLTAWNGPWGTSYAANLTPDSTGIGSWTEDQFLNCIRKGLYKGIEGSRPIMPPMPINSISKMTDDELKAIFAYLKTIKPVHNAVPEYQPPVGAK